MNNEFQYGPFLIKPTARVGMYLQKWEMSYNGEFLQEVAVSNHSTGPEITNALSDGRADFIRRYKEHSLESTVTAALPDDGYIVRLVESTATTGEKGREIDRFLCLAPIEGLTGQIIDDREKTWLVADTLGAATPMTEIEFVRLKEAHQAISAAHLTVALTKKTQKQPPLAWVANLLPDAIMTEDFKMWRNPTSWEIRHIVGEGSFSGLSGAKAAEMIGISPANFRKYTAGEDAKNRQKMSYAMWHLLIKKIGVTA